MTDIYIPPEGLYFRLLGFASRQVIFARNSPSPDVGLSPVNDQATDQYFSFIYGTGERADLYAIKSKATGKVLFSRTHKEPYVGQIDGDGRYNDNWFKIEPGKTYRSKYFRLVAPSTGTALVSRTHLKPYFWNHPQTQVCDDQYFTFLFEDMSIDKIEYDLKDGRILSSTPNVLATQVLENSSSQTQEMSFHFSETLTQTSTFDYTAGFTIAVGTAFKAGVPFFAETEFKVDISVNNEWKWGEENTFSKTYAATFSVRAGPGETVKAVSTVDTGTLSVPFTAYLSSKSTGFEVTTEGIWRGVSNWNLRHVLTSATA
ncbi:hemolytic lectin LSLb [Laetiporus sulphureus 93-53]|uniref:Hemolytic lectin LSLb n=2 Tax=Laetiporus sulphureus TaxID=5630 RepID=A0A165GMS8_9APHY|nr:hemolytic lectin LSLb [Laetiporus sulphureus 93-53]KZT10565.1 hemolytic lectin LSLb [Laetiporus sulphureus 93-53]BAC78489.1 Hemolytic lectin LSLb [Laetiporus sulphureus]